MLIPKNSSGLFTDFYELTMAQGYFLSGRKDNKAVFDYFFRKNPFGGGFVIFAGLQTVLDTLENYHFEKSDLEYLESLGFEKRFLEFLKDFHFEGHLSSFTEGEVVFPNEPIVRVEGNIIETQLVESLLLNILNFQSLIATKAARLKLAAKNKVLLEFGLRRAQGLAAIHASRAAVIGGCDTTSNTYSARLFGIQPSGTMAHSWIQTFEDEKESFAKFAEYYPESSVFLVDTYNTLEKGIPNAIAVAKEMEKKGRKLYGIRLDSGDLAYLSKKARHLLDAAGLAYVKIVVSNQLDELVITSLLQQNAPIDAFGVGTSLATGMQDAALDGVYKLAVIRDKPTMKVSENVLKMTLPGKKNVFRFRDPESNCFCADGIELSDFDYPQQIYHPHFSEKNMPVSDCMHEQLMQQVMRKGRKIIENKTIKSISQYVHKRLDLLPDENKRFENPHIYKVGIGKELMDLRKELKDKI
jgi:nicotinate phosphoribosyltransferase